MRVSCVSLAYLRAADTIVGMCSCASGAHPLFFFFPLLLVVLLRLLSERGFEYSVAAAAAAAARMFTLQLLIAVECLGIGFSFSMVSCPLLSISTLPSSFAVSSTRFYYYYYFFFLLATATNTHTHTHTEYSLPSTIASSLLPKLIAVSSIPLLITLALFRVAERSAMPAFTAKLALLLVAFALLASYASADCAISGCINCALSNPNMCLVCDDGFHLTSIGSCLEEGNGAHGPQSMAVAALVLLLGMLMYVL